MAAKAGTKKGGGGHSGVPHLVPTQQRSRERFERILKCAAEVMAEKGADAFRMSDIVERTGVAFGSLYQYFPDKTAIIGTLAERYNQIGRDCVARNLSGMEVVEELHPVLAGITDGYYQMFVDHPVMRDIWTATQADRSLQQLDADDGEYLAGLLTEAVRRVAPGISPTALSDFSQLTMTLIAAAVRHAITLSPREAKRMLALFKRLLPRDLSALT
jgi:AcrR family transcriptional regulator